jgi:hypothetical protein
MPKKAIPIKYTDREYQSIRTSLIDHAKRYYPNTFRDYSEGSFGSLMIDTVSYVGDILSFYLDYQVNETFLDTAIEYDNIARIGQQLGYKVNFNTSAYGFCTFYIIIPAVVTGTMPDRDYVPLLKKGTTLGSQGGASFLLDEDVDFGAPNVEIRVAQVDPDTGVPTAFAYKAYGRVVSGELVEEFIEVGEYEKFRKLQLETRNITEILFVFDDEGNEYAEVDYLSQDVVYKGVTNRTDTRDSAPEILKPFVVPRRFVAERDRNFTYLQFGASSDAEVDNENVVRPNLVDPSQVVLQRQGSIFIKDSSLDPYRLIDSDEFGVSPSNTTLTVGLRVNSPGASFTPVSTVTSVTRPIYEFANENILNSSDLSIVKNSIEVTNEEQIIGSFNAPTSEELKIKIMNYYATQNRAVTAMDYQAMAYAMPPQFGSVKRVRIMRDPDSLKRNLNMYVMSSTGGNQNVLIPANDVIKQNLKTWILKNKMINDTIDILDAKIINFQVEYEAIGSLDQSKFDILQVANSKLRQHFSRVADIGEPFMITDVYQVLKEVESIIDVTNVRVTKKTGSQYSDVRFSVRENTSADGRMIHIPKNCIYEIKFPDTDIIGLLK